MNKIVLCISRPGMTSKMIQQGYIDTLEHLGWRVYCGNPKTKLCCSRWIKEYGIQFIMTHSKYGMRQLPIQVINDNQVTVAVNALPLNSTNSTIDGPYEFAHDDEPDLVKEIRDVIVHTCLEPNTWSQYMHGWKDNNIDIVHLPVAGNIIKALSPTCSVLTDVAMVANFSHRQDIMKQLIEPLFKRLDLLGYSYQAFGDNIWQLAGLNYNGPLIEGNGRLAHIYATAKVSPNVHTQKQVSLQACVNERSFMIPLCGGVQVSDNPLISKYLGQHCEIATSTTDFMNKVISAVENQSRCFERIRTTVEYVANNHTYFNRLTDLFNAAGLPEFGNETRYNGQRAAIRHCWGFDVRLSAEERGISYEEYVVGTS